VYRVFRKSTLEPKSKSVAVGLTTPAYTEPAPERGESVSYSVVAVAADESVSAMSQFQTVVSPKPKKMED
jgi:hypothetical protein